MNALFVCSRNRLRSPTAEHVFARWPGLHTASAGTSADADEPVSPELLKWADLVFVMEPVHRRRLASRFATTLRGKRVVCLDIPDDFEFMSPALVALLHERVSRHLPQAPGHAD